MHHVVVVEVGDQVAARLRQRNVARRARARAVVTETAQTFAGKAGEKFGGGVDAAVVND